MRHTIVNLFLLWLFIVIGHTLLTNDVRAVQTDLDTAPRTKLSINIEPDHQLKHIQQIQCLAAMIWGEARGESMTDKISVAYTVMTYRKPEQTVCDSVLSHKVYKNGRVVYRYTTFSYNPRLIKVALDTSKTPRLRNRIERDAWADCLHAAEKVYRGLVKDPTGGATHYYAPELLAEQGLPEPRWAKKFRKTFETERHVYYAAL